MPIFFPPALIPRQSVPSHDDPAEIEQHYEERSDFDLIGWVYADLSSPAVTGAMVPQVSESASDPGLIEAANRALRGWWRNC
jgi:hypothetical protein